MRSTIERQKEAFRRKFGRSLSPEDPLFFDPNSDTPQSLDRKGIKALMVEAMEKAGVEPARIYLYMKTGLIVNEENIGLLSEQEYAEWEQAIQEWEEMNKGNEKDRLVGKEEEQRSLNASERTIEE